MKIEATALPEVKLLTPTLHGDARGYFAEMYNRTVADAAGISATFVQDNQSLSRQVGVVRGLHYQLAPRAQGKLIRVLKGAILDVAVDIRRGSPTFGKHVRAVLSAENFQQLYVPAGFAHGFATLAPDTEVLYKVTDYYSPQHDRGILWNDPALGIDWGLNPELAVLSDKDRRHPTLKSASDLPDM